MAHITADRVLETSTTTGTGAFTLAGAVTGFRAFSAVCSTNDTVPYFIEAVDGSGVPTGDWETGFGTYSGANTLTRTTVVASSNSDSAVNFSAGTKRVGLGLLGSVKTDIQTFTASGTWTKPAWATTVEVILIGGGGGGGSGRKGAAGTARTGGSGGGGGGVSNDKLRASDLPATVGITVGAGGAGGASQTLYSTNGIAGSDGGTTAFGSYLYASGGGGGGGGASSNASAGAGGMGTLASMSGASGYATIGGAAPIGTSHYPGACYGGGGGGPVTSGNAALGGGQGFNSTTGTAPPWRTGTIPTANNSIVAGNGNSGTDLTTATWLGGESGDGGGASITGNAGAGGNGGKWGGGGGGGGAAVNGVGNSGAGGNGADGLAVVISRS